MMQKIDNRSRLDWTLEIVPAHADRLESLSGLVNEIFITMITGTEESEIIDSLAAVQAAGFAPVPHIAARSFASKRSLGYFCDGLRNHTIEKVLLIGGGLGKPSGPFTTSLQILQSDAFQNVGIQTVAFAGHPEGNPVDSNPGKSLRDKLSFLQQQGTQAEVVTQWSFSPEKVKAYLARLKAEGIDVPVRVGVPAPPHSKPCFATPRFVASRQPLKSLKNKVSASVNSCCPVTQQNLSTR